ncbi:MAG: CRISPR-associated helicase/endonuclease Cas3 [Betaproteobacteria bacterium]|nr:CRISPR-associated helicase/endonuclease Cas3 [Betaproteobacteria bacterium]
MANQTSFLRYWGKADPNYPDEPKWHPLAYHCLDVAAVTAIWWDVSPVIRRTFLAAFDWSDFSARKLRAWVIFFITLHDLGKFDVRFQSKALDALCLAWADLKRDDVDESLAKHFDHGRMGYALAMRELSEWSSVNSAEIVDAWRPWLAAVTGHHGDLSSGADVGSDYAEAHVMDHDREARRMFVAALTDMFLRPAGLSLLDIPPACTVGAQSLLAGYCAVCDWIGSNVNSFPYRKLDANITFADYLAGNVNRIVDDDLLRCFGLRARANTYGGVADLLRKDESPRGVQILVNSLPLVPGLTLIEAPTGSGKTETALAYAWRLLDVGLADSIVFALPTQATANAMLTRAKAFAEKAIGRGSVVLAHGNRNLNPEFEQLVDAGRRETAQGKEEATIQCAAWLASSRKRVFLGQVGICTVDQVLLSVLPVRHKFVRGFGLNKSVLIVDEVHAYDAYMHGLLGEVLRRQKVTGGSAMLLSATLPAGVRSKLFQAWGAEGADDPPYPVVWHATQGRVACLTVTEAQRPPRREVDVECLKLPGAFPDDSVLNRMLSAAESGARIAVVVNLVDDAQRLTRILRDRTALPVDVFHARYRFRDRQQREEAVKTYYGRNAHRDRGRILVATQVVEQSLDLDFDWMITQICPVDLLFQRLGRLHRHDRPRPIGFEMPRCTVLSVEGEDYALHKLIYGNTRVLWRTERLLACAARIAFPAVYRDWIEQVYAEPPWDDEPDETYGAFRAWRQDQEEKEARAIQLTTMTVSQFRDEDSIATSLTRDDEMSLTVLLIQPDGRLLDGESLDELDGRKLAETLSVNAVPAPASWKKRLAGCERDDDGRVCLEMTPEAQGGWTNQEMKLRYSEDYGLERKIDESA